VVIGSALGEPVRHEPVLVHGRLRRVHVVGQGVRAAPAVGVVLVQGDGVDERRPAQVRVDVVRGQVVGRQGAGAVGARLAVVPGVDVVLHDVVPLPVRAEGAAGLLVDVGVGDDVGADVRDPAEGEGLELLQLVLVAVLPELALGLGEQVARHLVGLAVVEHVAPQEGVLVVAGAHLEREPAEDVLVGGELLLDDELERRAELADRRARGADDAAGEGVERGVGGADDRADGGVPDLDEVVPGLVELDQDPYDVGEGLVDLGQDRQQRPPVLVLGVVGPVVDGHGEHEGVAGVGGGGERQAGVVLAEEEQVGPDGADVRVLRPLLHHFGAPLRRQAGGAAGERADAGQVPRLGVVRVETVLLPQPVGQAPGGVDVREVSGHPFPPPFRRAPGLVGEALSWGQYGAGWAGYLGAARVSTEGVRGAAARRPSSDKRGTR
jgi:hypothetical protein